MRKSGIYKPIGNVDFFMPYPLPPKNPSFTMDAEMVELYGQAMQQLGKLKEMNEWLPNKEQFIKAYVKKEALLSSSIEGIHTTLLEAFTQPLLQTKPSKDMQLVMNYTKTLYASIKMIKKENLPISTRVILKAHKELMQITGSSKSNPGNYRKQTVTVGNLVPPPANDISKLMSELETFINVNETIYPLIKIGLVHVQFETIHPFLDGNGRIGRLLIVLMLIEMGFLSDPIIYPSYYFKKRPYDYYGLLDRVRTKGDFESWIKYYLSVIRDSAQDACWRARDIEQLRKKMTEIISIDKRFANTRETRIKALTALFEYPIIKVQKLSTEIGVSYNTASKIISDFVEIGFLTSISKKKRGKLFKFVSYFEILERDYKIF